MLEHHQCRSLILAVRLESATATARLVTIKDGAADFTDASFPAKDIQSVSSDDPSRIVEVIAFFANQARNEQNVAPPVAITCPGTIDPFFQTIMKSSRLNITQPLQCGRLLRDIHGITACVFNDAISIARAELRNAEGGRMPSDAVFIMVGEGVGSAIYMDGRLYVGAGAGGHIGRMVVNPDGPMSDRFNLRGTLEVYTSLQWIVQRLVGENRDDFDKIPIDKLRGLPYFRFRQILQAAKTPRDVTAKAIADAWRNQDPLVVSAFEDAAAYLGRCISSIITLLNPPLIVVGGELIDTLPSYFERAVAYARRYSSRLAWEKTRLLRAAMGLDAQYLGVAELAFEFLQTHVELST